jgi:RNA polymerase sigma-70 factor (sigma-E family)
MGARTAIVGTEVGDERRPDEGGIEDLYLRSVPAAVRLAFLITGDAHLAEDVAQEAFLRATGRFAHLRSPSAFDAYLRRAVVNLCTSQFRHRKVERAYLAREAGRAPASVPAPDIGERDELRAALRELPPRQRAAVVLRYYEDLSEHQAGEALGVSDAAVRSLVARAMETLRDRIRKDEP